MRRTRAQAGIQSVESCLVGQILSHPTYTKILHQSVIQVVNPGFSLFGLSLGGSLYAGRRGWLNMSVIRATFYAVLQIQVLWSEPDPC